TQAEAGPGIAMWTSMHNHTTRYDFKRLLIFVPLLVAALVATPMASQPTKNKKQNLKAHKDSTGQVGKHDSALEDNLKKGTGDSQRVIIRVRPGMRQALRQYLNSQGASQIKAEHNNIDAITAVVPTSALKALEANP